MPARIEYMNDITTIAGSPSPLMPASHRVPATLSPPYPPHRRTAAPPDPAGAGGAVADPQHAPAAALNRDVCGGEPGHVRVCDEVVDRPGWVRGRRVALGTSQAIRPGRLGVHRFAD